MTSYWIFFLATLALVLVSFSQVTVGNRVRRQGGNGKEIDMVTGSFSSVRRRISRGRLIKLSALFLIVLAGTRTIPAANVTNYDLFNSAFYQQTSAAQPAAPANFLFDSRIFLDAPISGATSNLHAPDNQNYSMGTSGTVFDHSQSFADQASLSATYPAGTYTFSLQANQISPNSQTGTVTLPATPFYSQSVPFFTNFSSLQMINPNQATTFSWNSFVTNPAAPLSQIFFSVFDNTTNMLVVNQFFADPTTTSFIVPAGTFTLGDSYRASVFFSSRDPNTGSGFNGINGLVGFDRATDMNFTPVAAVPEAGSSALFLTAGIFALGLFWYSRPPGARRKT